MVLKLFCQKRKRFCRGQKVHRSSQTDDFSERLYGSDALKVTPKACLCLRDHPLISGLLNTALPLHFRSVMLNPGKVFKYGAMVPITSQGQLLYQLRRGGRQSFGGGQYDCSGACAAMLARNEAFMEANLIMNDDCVLKISRPIWVYNSRQSRFAWVQAVLLDHEKISFKDHCIYVGNRPVWSRETAHAYLHFEDAWHFKPSWRTIRQSQQIGEKLCFNMTHIGNLQHSSQSALWRDCDRKSLEIICGLLGKGELWTESSVHVDLQGTRMTDMPLHLQCIAELAHIWSTEMGDIAQQPFPLLGGRAYLDLYRHLSIS